MSEVKPEVHFVSLLEK